MRDYSIPEIAIDLRRIISKMRAELLEVAENYEKVLEERATEIETLRKKINRLERRIA